MSSGLAVSSGEDVSIAVSSSPGGGEDGDMSQCEGDPVISSCEDINMLSICCCGDVSSSCCWGDNSSSGLDISAPGCLDESLSVDTSCSVDSFVIV